MKLHWYYPGFVDTDERKTVEVASVEEFYALPRIVDLSTTNSFLRWTVSKECLMMECKESFWVTAFLDEDLIAALNLPPWVNYLKKDFGGTNDYDQKT